LKTQSERHTETGQKLEQDIQKQCDNVRIEAAAEMKKSEEKLVELVSQGEERLSEVVDEHKEEVLDIVGEQKKDVLNIIGEQKRKVLDTVGEHKRVGEGGGVTVVLL